jgi:enoyl-CoA hydratase/carnithine racemase
MTAETLAADAALQLGLVTELSTEPGTSARQLAQLLSQRSPDAVAAVKRLYRKSWTGSEGAALARETLYQWRILAGANQRISVQRQLGKDIPFKT